MECVVVAVLILSHFYYFIFNTIIVLKSYYA